MKKMGMCIKLKKSKVQEYKTLHKNCPKEIRDILTKANIKNYSIFLKEPENILFSYFDYLGNNFTKDMQDMADNEINKQWWDLCSPCQEPFKEIKKSEWWFEMPSVFYND